VWLTYSCKSTDTHTHAYTDLEPVDGAAVDERRKHSESVAERVADWTHRQDDMKILFHSLHEEVVHRQRRHLKLTTLKPTDSDASSLVLVSSLLSYSERLLRLNLESLGSRHVEADWVLLFKIIHGLVYIDHSAMFDIQSDRTTRGHDLRIRKCHSNVDARKFHFCNRVIDAWNDHLLSHQVHLKSVKAFKVSIAHFVF